MTFALLPLALIHNTTVSKCQPAMPMPEAILHLALIRATWPCVHLQHDQPLSEWYDVMLSHNPGSEACFLLTCEQTAVLTHRMRCISRVHLCMLGEWTGPAHCTMQKPTKHAVVACLTPDPDMLSAAKVPA